jgi:hypothetical protein
MDEEKSLRPPHKTDSKNQVYQPRAEQQDRAWNTMRWFDGTPKTQAGFYARFQEMADEDTMFLKCFYDITDDWDLFKMICKFWNVPLTSRRVAVTAAAGLPTP